MLLFIETILMITGATAEVRNEKGDIQL